LAIIVPEAPPTRSGAEKISERENESKGCPGEQAGNRKWQDDAQKRLRYPGAEVMRGLDKRARYVLEAA